MVKRIEPNENQESVWDYPRPPRVESSSKRIRVLVNDTVIADSMATYRILETSHPPVYYIPQGDIEMSLLTQTAHRSFCEFKGQASYWTLRLGDRVIEDIAWMYANPNKAYAVVKDHLAFYANRVDACFVGDEQVQPQPGDFYGGWITKDIVGPFKGGAGTWGW